MDETVGFANFAWVFEAGAQSFYTALIAANDKSQSIIGISNGLVPGAAFIGLMIALAKTLHASRDWAELLVSGLVAMFLLSPTTLQMDGRAPINVTMGQRLMIVPIASVYNALAKAIRSSDSSNALVIADLGERQAAPFAGSDLARLMRDYQTYCQPTESSPGVPTEAWLAVGLRGGGGLGVPAEHLSVFSEVTATKAKESFFGWFGAFRAVDALAGAYKAGQSRNAGVEALKSMRGQWPADRRYYSLPDSDSWGQRFGRRDGASSTDAYLDPRKVGDGLGPEGATYPPGSVNPPFSPSSCYTAYQAAQAGAEAAYNGLRGTLRPADMNSSTEVSAVDSIAAWSSVVDRSLQSMYGGGEGGIIGPGRKAAAELVGAGTAISGFFAKLDLVTELPRVVFMINFVLAMYVVIMPLIFLCSIFSGFGVVLYAMRIMAFGFATLFLIELSFSMMAAQFAVSQYLIAAQSISMTGVATDVQGQRGVLVMLISGAITMATMGAARLFGIMTPPSMKPGGSSLLSSMVRTGISLAAAPFTGGGSAKVAIATAAKGALKSSAPRGGGGGGGPTGPAGPAGGVSTEVQRSIRAMAAANTASNARSPKMGHGPRAWPATGESSASRNISPLIPKRG